MSDNKAGSLPRKPSWEASGKQEATPMTEEQADRIVENLCVHLRHAIRVTGTEAFPSNLRELGFDAASVKTAVKTALNAAGITVTPPAPPPPLP
jgi:hypothetical protein